MSQKRPVALVTGANGEIGRSLIEALHRDGRYRIVTLDLSPLPEKYRPLCFETYAGNILDRYLLDQLAADAGRDPSSIRRAASLSLSEPWDQVQATAESLRAVGVSSLICGWPSEGRARVQEFVDQVLPSLQAD